MPISTSEAGAPASSDAPSAAGGPETAAIRRRALELGFDAVGFADPADIGAAGERLAAFIARGWHGDMGWLAERAAVRGAPKLLWPEAASAIVVAANYGPRRERAGNRLLDRLRRPHLANISIYAQGRDYHKVLKKRLRRLGRWLADEHGADCRLFVDTAPVMEKPLAQMAGLGWIGKHTNLVSRNFGSWLFLGVLMTTLDLAPAKAAADRCGRCRACLDVCPTDAFPAPYRLDARRCISYLTIEHKGHIPREFRRAIGNRIFGCDDCLAVCPWNKFARMAADAELRPRRDLEGPALAEFAALDDDAFRDRFAGTAVKRTGRDRFVRNVMIALGNSGERAVAPLLAQRLGDASPLVRAMAVWALGRLLDRAAFERLRRRHLPHESDGNVRDEWAAPG